MRSLDVLPSSLPSSLLLYHRRIAPNTLLRTLPYLYSRPLEMKRSIETSNINVCNQYRVHGSPPCQDILTLRGVRFPFRFVGAEMRVLVCVQVCPSFLAGKGMVDCRTPPLSLLSSPPQLLEVTELNEAPLPFHQIISNNNTKTNNI